MARVTGGIERTAWDDIFHATGLRHRQIRDLILPLTLVLLVLHVGEIAGRRLLAFAAASAWLRSLPERSGRLVTRRSTRERKDRPGGVAPADVPATGDAVASAPAPANAAAASQNPNEPPPPVPPRTPAESPLARAKARARSRLGD
jgi:hypothetical protein